MASTTSPKRTAEAAGLYNADQYSPSRERLNSVSSSSPVFDDAQSTPISSRCSTPLSPAATSSSTGTSTQERNTEHTPTSIVAPKRQKLTFAEKEVKRIEKQYKEQQKAEDRARKEEEKQAKEEARRAREEETREERKRKEEEKGQKRRIKEAEKKLKEEERRRKEVEKKISEDEKAKKEKSQLRLVSFFTKSAIPSGNSISQDRSGPSSRRSSIASLNGPGPQITSRIETREAALSEYEQTFQPFFIHTHTTVAPINRFCPNEMELECTISVIDKSIGADDAFIGSAPPSSKGVMKALKEQFCPVARRCQRRRYTTLSVRSIMAQIRGSSKHPIDLTCAKSSLRVNPLDSLRAVSVKFLKYAEDVRPPYIGTYSKVPQDNAIRQLCRNPFARALLATNYDYDSEAEWEEPEEGEDLDSEGEEEVGDDDEGDDMEEFLDDEGAEETGPNGSKRRHLMGDVLPVYTGLHWDAYGHHIGPQLVPYGQASLDLKIYKIRTIHDSPWPIDPYSTSYWRAEDFSKAEETCRTQTTSTMPPPARAPLHVLHGTNTILLPDAASTDKSPNKISKSMSHGATSKSKPSALSKPMPPEILDDFRRAIDGSDLTKAGLLEVLKKKFPQVTKGTIQDTVAQIAHRVGRKEVEKRWCLM